MTVDFFFFAIGCLRRVVLRAWSRGVCKKEKYASYDCRLYCAKTQPCCVMMKNVEVAAAGGATESLQWLYFATLYAVVVVTVVADFTSTHCFNYLLVYFCKPLHFDAIFLHSVQEVKNQPRIAAAAAKKCNGDVTLSQIAFSEPRPFYLNLTEKKGNFTQD